MRRAAKHCQAAPPGAVSLAPRNGAASAHAYVPRGPFHAPGPRAPTRHQGPAPRRLCGTGRRSRERHCSAEITPGPRGTGVRGSPRPGAAPLPSGLPSGSVLPGLGKRTPRRREGPEFLSCPKASTHRCATSCSLPLPVAVTAVPSMGKEPDASRPHPLGTLFLTTSVPAIA